MGKNKPLFEEILQKTAACFVILGEKIVGKLYKRARPNIHAVRLHLRSLLRKEKRRVSRDCPLRHRVKSVVF